MGKQARVALFGEQRRNIVVEDGATEGAVLGQNLVRSDGTVVQESDILNSSITTINTGPGGVITDPTVWELIVGVPDIIDSLEDLTDDGWIRNDGGTLSALHWPYVKPAVDSGESFTLPAGEQLIVYESFDVAGSLTLNGQLVILGPDKDTGVVRDVIPNELTLFIPEDHQFIVMDKLEVEGVVENGGVLAVIP